MDTQADLLLERPEGVGLDPVHAVIQDLRLAPERHPAHPSALLLHKNGSGPIAVLLPQGSSLREDRGAIEALKAADKDLPIIYIARSTRPRRETAIRRLCIHYFLAYPVEGE